MTRKADIEFCKSFWNIAESPLLQNIPMLVCPPVEISEMFELPATAFSVPSRDPSIPGPVLIQPPLSHSGPGPVSVRLISYTQREGQGWINNCKSRVPPSPHLLVHCHGGGFVAQSSRSHEVYLRHWAKQLDCPILSIDYSLAPEHPFPRALEECFYAYCWALRNCRRLGSTGQSIVVCGDSAGGNLMISLCLRAIEFGVRLPDGVLGVYTPVLVKPQPSPSRILSVMDPLLPIGVLLRCLLAYAGINEANLPRQPLPPAFRSGLSSTNSPEEENVIFSADASSDRSSSSASLDSVEDAAFDEQNLAELDLAGGLQRAASFHDFGGRSRSTSLRWTTELVRRHITQNPHGTEAPLFRMQLAPIPADPYMSPYLATDDVLCQLPPTALIACQLDPVLDDCVEFAKRLTALKCHVNLRVLEDMPHGFLNFALLSKDAMRGSDECVKQIEALFEKADGNS